MSRQDSFTKSVVDSIIISWSRWSTASIMKFMNLYDGRNRTVLNLSAVVDFNNIY